MYKLTKPRGMLAGVILENTETKVTINLGGISIKMLEILKDEGYSKEEGTLNNSDIWDLDISAEAKDKLAKLAMPMKKPIRDQKKKPEDQVNNAATPDGEVDVFNLIYGNVDY